MSYPKNGATVKFILIYPSFASHSNSLASVICSIVELVSERGVTHALGTQDPPVPRNLHTKFHLNRFSRSSVKSFMALTQTDKDTGRHWDRDFFICKL